MEFDKTETCMQGVQSGGKFPVDRGTVLVFLPGRQILHTRNYLCLKLPDFLQDLLRRKMQRKHAKNMEYIGVLCHVVCRVQSFVIGKFQTAPSLYSACLFDVVPDDPESEGNFCKFICN